MSSSNEQRAVATPNAPDSVKSIVQAADPRAASRVPAPLQTIVQVKEDAENSWKEITNLATVSKNGAGFHLSRPCGVGRLVTLVIPMPEDLRAYDHSERLYPVLGLVQYCNEGLVNNVKCYHVGVAFIGKQMPASFKADPQQNYRITGMSANGLWSITETESDFQARRNPRFWVSLEVSITILHSERREIYKDTAITQNIGASGASVFSALEANVNDKVKFAYKEFNFYTVAVVRQRKEKEGQTPTLHLEFIDNEFPVERLRSSRFVAGAEKDRGALAQAWPETVEYDRHKV